SGAAGGNAPGGRGWQKPDIAPGAQGPGDRGPAGGGAPGMRPAGNGDLSQLIDRIPKVSAGDLKKGDAVIVAGSPSAADKSSLLAANVIAGVEPIFQSASPRQAQSLGGDWG